MRVAEHIVGKEREEGYNARFASRFSRRFCNSRHIVRRNR